MTTKSVYLLNSTKCKPALRAEESLLDSHIFGEEKNKGNTLKRRRKLQLF